MRCQRGNQQRSRPARILVAVTGVLVRWALVRGRAFSQPARDLLLSADSAKHRDWIPDRRAAALHDARSDMCRTGHSLDADHASQAPTLTSHI